MKFTTATAIAMMLVIGGASGAIAREKPAAAPAYDYKLGKPFRTVAGPLQAAIASGDTATATAKLGELDTAATTPDEKYVAAQLRLQLAQKTNDARMQAQAVDGMIASGSGAAAADLPKLYAAGIQFAYQAGNYPRAVELARAADQANIGNPDVYLLGAEANFKANQIPTGLGYLDKAIALQPAGSKAPEDWYKRAASVAYQAKLMPQAAVWMRKLVTAYPTPTNWRDALVIYRDSATRDPAINLDVFRLMRANKSLVGERDYFEYASLATDRGLPGEAKAVIDEGFATSQAPQSSRPLNELRGLATTKIAVDRPTLAASERQAAAASTGRPAAATADAYLGYGEDAKAIPLYRTALQKGGIDADAVNLHLGIALTRTGDKAGARTAFTAVKGARAEVASFWLLWLDQQAG